MMMVDGITNTVCLKKHTLKSKMLKETLAGGQLKNNIKGVIEKIKILCTMPPMKELREINR